MRRAGFGFLAAPPWPNATSKWAAHQQKWERLKGANKVRLTLRARQMKREGPAASTENTGGEEATAEVTVVRVGTRVTVAGTVAGIN